MLAIQLKKIEIIKLLIGNKANISQVDNLGKSVFEYAINTNDNEIINLIK